MACFKYSVRNIGTKKAFGEYTKASTLGQIAWYCPPLMTINISDVLDMSITGEDVSYFNTYVKVTRIGSCNEEPAASTCTVLITDVDSTANTAAGVANPNGTATISINETISDYEFSLDNVIWQASNVFTKLGGFSKSTNAKRVNYTAYVRKKSDHSCYTSQPFTLPDSPVQLFASAQVIKHPSQPGASDGEIRITFLNGSGNFTVEFSHDGIVHPLNSGSPLQSMVKVGLAAGEYTIEVLDVATGQTMELEATLTDPVLAPPPPGSFLDVPFMNSIHFVHEDLSEDETPDNRLLVNQFVPGYTKTNYFNPFTNADFPTTQFNTDFEFSKCELYSYGKDELIKTFPEAVLLEKNIGRTSDYQIRIEADSQAGRSRVYFTGGAPPIAIYMDTTFEIVNNLEGYNGVYNPIAIETDPNLGYSYIVITKDWTQPSGTDFVFATGRFPATDQNYNVYEFMHSFSDVPEGCYFMRLVAFDSLSEKMYKSEPIIIKAKHPKTKLLTYSNRDNCFGLSFVHGYTGIIRIPALHGHKRTPGSEAVNSRNSDTSLIKVSARMFRRFPLDVFLVPMYIHEKIATAIQCDDWTINGVAYQTEEGYPEPVFIDRCLLANASVIIEQVGWFDKYNSDDMGTIYDGGGLISGNGGFIRR